MLLVPFLIGGERYAFRAADILTVIQVPRVRPVPHAPSWVMGIFRYRGIVLPAVDLGTLISGTPCRNLLSTRLLLVGSGQSDSVAPALGLLAERVTGTMSIDQADVRETGVHMKDAHWLGSVVGLDHGLLQLIRWEPLVTDDLTRLCAEAAACD